MSSFTTVKGSCCTGRERRKKGCGATSVASACTLWLTKPWGRLIGWSGGIHEVPQRPRFCLVPSNSIQRHSTSVRIAKMSHNSNSYNTANSYNSVWNNYTIADGRSQILTWLSLLEPGLRQRSIHESRVKNMREWLLETEGCRGWYASGRGSESDKPVFFCYGDPGAGKTFIRCFPTSAWMCSLPVINTRVPGDLCRI